MAVTGLGLRQHGLRPDDTVDLDLGRRLIFSQVSSVPVTELFHE